MDFLALLRRQYVLRQTFKNRVGFESFETLVRAGPCILGA